MKKHRRSDEKPGTMRRRLYRERLARLEKLRQAKVSECDDNWNEDDDDDKPRVYRLASNPSPYAREQRRMMDEDEDDEEETEEQIQAARQRYAVRRRRTVYDDDDEEDDDGVYDQDDFADELSRILKSIDYTRTRLTGHQSQLSRLLDQYPEFAAQWEKFQKAGGVSSEDFRLFLQGKLRPKVTRQRKHLRLVSTRKPVPIKIKKPGNDAA